jgi:FKBP-type peptidyl-prolyl cis-trans isomerase
MIDKKIIVGFVLVIGAFLILNATNMTYNQRTPVSTNAANTQLESRLKSEPEDNLETLSTPLTDIVKETKMEANTSENREVKFGDRITVQYRGWFASNGEIFDQSFNRGDEGFSFIVGQGVIEGWSEGVVGMKLGEVRRLKIPSDLAYGPADYNGIPGGSDLRFDVELVKFNN